MAIELFRSDESDKSTLNMPETSCELSCLAVRTGRPTVTFAPTNFNANEGTHASNPLKLLIHCSSGRKPSSQSVNGSIDRSINQ